MTRTDLINRLNSILACRGIEWSANRVVKAVRRYQQSASTIPLEEFLAHEILRQADQRPLLNELTYRRIAYRDDPTGEDAVRNMSKYVPLKVAAETVGVSVSSLRRYIAEGRITAHRVGPKLIRVDLVQVEAQLFGEVGGDAA
ncbi:Gene 36 protein (Gp36), probable excisionase [Mycolicibacterium fortuitum]|uniref:Gene 36 protein (Gp36), probable excisionase n=1 Tax=Mycolicibacterium fortuitum TaxID=1766 RepID=A0A378U8P9_MYCFO|nr:Gene 36 protein (Gp36), probable excisionase [Mycolicibacterium fortuitum]